MCCARAYSGLKGPFTAHCFLKVFVLVLDAFRTHLPFFPSSFKHCI